MSEERFAASLDANAVEHASGETKRPRQTQREEAWSLVGAAGSSARSRAAEQGGSNDNEGGQGVDQGAFWKQEVTSRLESFRARRRRPMRERSLLLDFERAVNRELTNGALCASREEERRVAVSEPPAEPVEEYVASAVPVELPPEESESNVIEFPRQPLLPVMPPSSEELAEPMLDRPRILEVPEEVDSAAPLGDIDVAPESEQRPEPEFELPLLVAPMSQRVIAGVLDAFVVIAGAALFAAIILKLGVPLAHDKGGLLPALAVPGLFWAVYEYLFLVNAGKTPGMRMARLQLVTFDGESPRRRARRGRALALVLSSLSLGLGLLWALLDEDTLCWHDRITRTYLVAGNSWRDAGPGTH